MNIKSISNYIPNKSRLSISENCNIPLSPMDKTNSPAPSLDELLSDEHYSLYSQENIETIIQHLERVERSKIVSNTTPAVNGGTTLTE